jgi:4-amino-4-deoxy-L-arabinose transferase-like glycosyltransferase
MSVGNFFSPGGAVRAAGVGASLLGLTLFSLLLAGMLTLGWVGYLASDDNAYIGRAEEWLSSSPSLPHDHWSTRHPLTLSIAASYRVFGSGELQAIVPSLLFGCAIIIITFFTTVSRFGLPAGLICGTLLSTTPLTIEVLTYPNVDVVEAFFVICAVICFVRSIGNSGQLHTLFISGLLSGLAIETRETAVALIIFFTLLFVFRPMMQRWRYSAIAAGTLSILAIEMLYYIINSGAPFLRYQIAIKAVATVDPLASGAGNVVGGWLASPLALLINNEFGLLFWVALAASCYLFIDGKTILHSRILNLITSLAVIWFVCIQYIFGLMPLPRYFFVPTVVATILAGVWLCCVVTPRHHATALIIFGTILFTNVILVDLSNQQLLLPERELVRLAAVTKKIVYTDPRTKWRAERLLKWAGLSPGIISDRTPTPGSLFLYSQKAIERAEAGPNGPFDPHDYTPSADWIPIYETRGTPTWTGRLLQLLGLEDWLRQLGFDRIIWEADPVVVYEVPGPQPGS